MADHQQQPTSAAYPPKQIADRMDFMDEILAELETAPDVQLEFLRLLRGLGKHGGDKGAVGSRATELLRGHPYVLRRFAAAVHMEAPAEQGLAALTWPRRSSSRSRRMTERRDTQQQTPAAAAPQEAPNVDAAAVARNHHGDDGLRLRLPNDAAARALTFVKRVHETAGPVVHARFLAVLSEATGSEDMSADEVYDRARQAFGPAHVGLLHAFATAWLPGEEEWKLQQARGPAAPARQRSRRRAAAAPSSHAGGMPDSNKKPRADDDGNAPRHDPRRQGNRAAASSHAAASMPDAKNQPRADDGNGDGRQHDHVIAVLEVRNVKKRRSDDDGTGRGRQDELRVRQSSGGRARAAPPQGRDDDYDYDYAPRSRAKKPRSGNGEFSDSAAAAARVLGADATGVHHVYSDNDKKPPRRCTANGGKGSSVGAAAVGPEQQPERDDEVRRFRQEWEFQTCYSKLVATSDRVTELLRRARIRTPHGDGGGNRSLEALFPLPECREFLRSYYGDRWGRMRAALERGESRVPALEAIGRGLRTKEEEAVAEESQKRCRHDPARVAQRLHGLAVDTLHEECRWPHHAGGGGA